MSRKRKSPGRTAGVKNIKKVDDGFIIGKDEGFHITEAERKEFRNLTQRLNRQREKMIAQYAGIERTRAGKKVGQTVGDLLTMGRESDFILTKRDYALQGFRSRGEFDRRMKQMRRATSEGYMDDRARLYKRNVMKSLGDAYGDEAKDVLMRIRMMKPEDFMRLVMQEEELELGTYIPSDEKADGRLNRTRKALGMKEKDEWPDEGEFDY